MTFRPMLAFPTEDKDIIFPVMASNKLDGLRATVVEGKVYTRSMKPFANKATSEFFSTPLLDGFDGELIVGDPTATNCFIASTSGLRRTIGDPKAVFYVFDLHDCPGIPFDSRYEELVSRVECLPEELRARVVVLEQRLVNNLEDVAQVESIALSLGFEGLILKKPDSEYANGRSRDMLKLKRFTDDEAELLGMIQLYMNDNDPKLNELGYTERSSDRDGMVPVEMMGALVVRDLKTGKIFNIGTGFDFEDRRYFWNNRISKDPVIVQNHAGKDVSVWLLNRPYIVKYKHFSIGNYDLPRFPSFQGERLSEDM